MSIKRTLEINNAANVARATEAQALHDLNVDQRAARGIKQVRVEIPDTMGEHARPLSYPSKLLREQIASLAEHYGKDTIIYTALDQMSTFERYVFMLKLIGQTLEVV